MSCVVRISEEKLSSDIKNVHFFERSYIQKAKEVAKAIVKADPEGTMGSYTMKDIETEQLVRNIRLDAANDKEILKGDYVILAFVDLYREEQEKKNYVNGKGKFLNASDELILSILRNDQNNGNVTEFCKNKGIHRSKYYRILNKNLKQEKDIHRIKKLEKEINKNL